MYVFICEDSLEGIFTGVYDACASRLGHRNIRLATGEPENYELRLSRRYSNRTEAVPTDSDMKETAMQQQGR